VFSEQRQVGRVVIERGLAAGVLEALLERERLRGERGALRLGRRLLLGRLGFGLATLEPCEPREQLTARPCLMSVPLVSGQG